MKVFDYSPIPFDGGKLSFQDRLKGIIQFGFNWVSEMKSQEIIIGNLNRVLDNHFTLLRNIPLPDGGATIPLVLLGSHGITVLSNSSTRGIFNAEGDSWKIMDNRLKDYKVTKPNLITRTLLLTEAFESFMSQAGINREMDGVLMFTDPGTHVNVTSRTDVRIIMMDAINRFGAGLLQLPIVMTMEDIRNLIESITEALQPKDETDESKRVIPYQQFAQSVDSGFLNAMAPLQEKFKFGRKEWALLWFFAIADILILVWFVVFILRTA
jgi:hypothetical protein